VSRDDHLEQVFAADLSQLLLRDIEARKEGRMSDRQDFVSSDPEATAHEVPTTVQQRRALSVPALVLSGIAIVTAVAVVLALNNQGGDVAASPVDVAESFLEARNAHDAEAMSALLVADALFVPGEELVMNERNLPEAAEFERITGWTHTVHSCVEDAPSRVRCSYTMENDLSRATGLVPPGSNFVIFEIEEGKIATVQNSGNSSYIGSGMSPFGTWLESNHPEEWETIQSIEMEGNKFSPEFPAIWEQRVPEFVADMSGE
jgi:hypothetical protein